MDILIGFDSVILLTIFDFMSSVNVLLYSNFYIFPEETIVFLLAASTTLAKLS